MIWLAKLISGWLPIGRKSFGEFIGKIIWVIGIILMVSLATNVWDKFFPPKPTVVNVAGDYIEKEKRDVARLGCTLWRGYVRTGILPK